MNPIEKYIGCLVGLAIGDAFGSGAPSHGSDQSKTPSDRSQGILPGGFLLYNSDTQRALLLAESLTECEEPNPEDLCARFLRMSEGPRHLPLGSFRRSGRNFRMSLDKLKADWAWDQSGADSPGIGTAARIAPLGLIAEDRTELIEQTIRLSLPTHRDPRAIAAAVAIAFLIFDEICGQGEPGETGPAMRLRRTVETVLEAENRMEREYRNRITLDSSPFLHQMSEMVKVVETCLDLDRETALEQIAERASALFGHPVSASTGLSLAGVSSAIWFAMSQAFDFQAAITEILHTRADAGSIGTIVGAICGCIRPDTIPAEWKDLLINVDQIVLRAKALAGLEIPGDLLRDFRRFEQTCTEQFHFHRKTHRTPLRAYSEVTAEDDRVFGIRVISGRSGDPCVFFFDGNLDLCGLFDLGRTFPLRPPDIRRMDYLFVTHSHIDHFIGFDHILRHSLNRPNLLHVFGPPHIAAQVQHRLRSYIWNLRRSLRLDIRIHEIDESTITVSNISMQTAFAHRDEEDSHPHQGVIFETERFLFRAATLRHGMPCLGYAIEEPASVRVDKDRLESSGLHPGPWLNVLKTAWRSGTLDETALDIRGREYPARSLAQDLLVEHPGRKVAYVVDTAYTDETRVRIVELARHADLFLCEAAFSQQLDADQAKRKFHLTAFQAGTLAREADVKRLHIFHFSRRYQTRPMILIREAKQAAGGIEVTY
ncbi:MAG TPA: ADP-ribosylglycohydrolase family protein [bacterium]|nr:ADP-ribosylglycohydrolase family protein [bacterium]HQP98535.1 ADP-ribosylglycohydrolase family protein [bacterium]